MSLLSIPGLQTYRTIPARRRKPVDWILKGLVDSGCRITAEPNLARAPFLFSVDVPGVGEINVCAYICTSTSRKTGGRPVDEARLQLKFGGKTGENLHYLVDDPSVTTLLLGVDIEHDLAVSADPLAHNPTKFYISIEYKHRHMSEIHEHGWHAWERERRDRRYRDEPIPADQSAVTETLVGITQARVLDLLLFERASRGLTPEYRHVLADRWLSSARAGRISSPAPSSHELIRMLGMNPGDLLDMIAGAPRLLMAVRGWTAQRHLGSHLGQLRYVERAIAIERDGQPDFEVYLHTGVGPDRPIRIECKNTLRGTNAEGMPKVDFQRTRAPKGNPCGRYYEASEFDILAACLHPITGKWEFKFRATRTMAEHRSCAGRLDHRVCVDSRWTSDLAAAIAAIPH